MARRSARGLWFEIRDLVLMEVSLVEKPADPRAQVVVLVM
jgi:hypothetical protein